MKTYMKKYLLVLGLVFAITGCDNWVQDIEKPINVITEEDLTTEAQIPFLVSGVKARFSSTYDQLTFLSGALSDELIFDTRVPNATFPTFDQLNKGDVLLDNNSVTGGMLSLGELLYFSDNLAERVGKITFKTEATKNDALYNANLYGAIARYFWGAYFGLNPEQGGGVINAGPFIASNQMYDDAVTKLKTALTFVQTKPYETKLVNSVIAKILFAKGDYAAAKAHAQAGLKKGDNPMLALYATTAANAWYNNAGIGRAQLVADPRYATYAAETGEATRVPLTKLGTTFVYYRQEKFPARESSIPFITWQENNLMLAEVAVREGDGATALSLVNEVRTTGRTIPALAENPKLDTILVEREKELFCQGVRLIDQRRTGKWHLGNTPAGTPTWQYMPITERERNANPNLK